MPRLARPAAAPSSAALQTGRPAQTGSPPVACHFEVPPGTTDNSPAIHRWDNVKQTRPSPGRAKEAQALDFVLPVGWDVGWFSFVPDGTHLVSRPFTHR